jgi:N6-L-threonylcarbamoyladenine synthase
VGAVAGRRDVIQADAETVSVFMRQMRESDLAGVVEIEAASFGRPWTYAMLAEELQQEPGWRTVAEDETGAVVGFLVGRCYAQEWHLLDLAVEPGRRRRGVGGRLLDEFLETADRARRPVLLEVRPGNRPAVSLYRSRGFTGLALRKGYYPDTDEDAMVMMRLPGETGLGRAGRFDGALLAIESSCDDTAAAVLDSHGKVLSSVSHSQDSIHERYGGVVPEVASRAHVERMTAVVSEALRQAGCGIDGLGAVAATVGPGLIGALLIGVQTAKTIAWSRRLPFLPVNHIHGHLAAAVLAEPDAAFPMVTLVASGGHTMLVRVDGPSSFTLLGQTLDDAAGEAFDKGARLLGLGYPGGKELDELAEKGDPGSFSFPVALRRSSRPDFSFSGVKTALYYLLRGMNEKERSARAADIAASYREAVVRALVEKTLRAARLERVPTVAVAGGVAANSLLRRRLAEAGSRAGLQVIIPPLAYCTDNAAMIGAAASGAPRLEYPDYLAMDASASLALGQWMPSSKDSLRR